MLLFSLFSTTLACIAFVPKTCCQRSWTREMVKPTGGDTDKKFSPTGVTVYVMPSLFTTTAGNVFRSHIRTGEHFWYGHESMWTHGRPSRFPPDHGSRRTIHADTSFRPSHPSHVGSEIRSGKRPSTVHCSISYRTSLLLCALTLQ